MAGLAAGIRTPRGRHGDFATCRVSFCNAALIPLRVRAPPNVKSGQPVPRNVGAPFRACAPSLSNRAARHRSCRTAGRESAVTNTPRLFRAVPAHCISSAWRPPGGTIPPRVHRVAPASYNDITENNMQRSLIALAFAGLGLSLSGLAHAVNVDVNIGTPPPVVVAPAPVVIVGWHGDRYWDGRRYWERREWEDHERHHGHEGRGGYHCPPGHAKKGEC